MQQNSPAMEAYVDAGPDLGAKQPTPYLYDAPSNVPHPEIHDSGIGSPSDRRKWVWMTVRNKIIARPWMTPRSFEDWR